MLLTERGLVEPVGTLGNDCLISPTINAFGIGLPELFSDELGEPEPGTTSV